MTAKVRIASKDEASLPDCEEAPANARLIAAAPDLLAAAEAILPDYENCPMPGIGWEQRCNALRAAIALAKGGRDAK